MAFLTLSSICLITLILSLVNAQEIKFNVVTNGLSWLRRQGSHLHTTKNPLNYTSQQGSFGFAPSGSFLLYGGWSDLYLTNVNDVWLSLNRGQSWVSLNVTESIFPTTPGCAFCTNPFTDHLYSISRYPANGISVWMSSNPRSWDAIKPEILYNSTNNTSPFLDRYGATCMTDSQSNVYYMLGLNWSSSSGETQYRNGTWKSSDQGRTWSQQALSQPFASRYGAMTGTHYNNSHLGGIDVMYILGGVTKDLQGYERNLNDLWVSSDRSASWSQISIQRPWGVGFTSFFAFHITNDGILILSTLYVNAPNWYGELWVSLDGGYNWNRCLQNAPYKERTAPSLTIDIDGYIYLMGGRSQRSFYYDDVWKSDISVYNWKTVAQVCNTTVPREGVGLTRWPGNHDTSSSSSSTPMFGSSSSPVSSLNSSSSSSLGPSSPSSSPGPGSTSSSSPTGSSFSSGHGTAVTTPTSSCIGLSSSTGSSDTAVNEARFPWSIVGPIVGIIAVAFAGFSGFLIYSKKKYGHFRGCWSQRGSQRFNDHHRSLITGS